MPDCSKRSSLAVVAASCFLGALWSGSSCAQSAEWARVLAAAKTEGKAMLYFAGTPPTLERLTEGFKKAHPDIVLESFRLTSTPLIARIEQEVKSGADGADVFLTSDLLWIKSRAREGRLLKPSGPALKGWPAKYLVDGMVVIGGLEPFVIGYNRNLVKTPPQTYADLFKPEFKGKLGTPDMASSTVAAFYGWLEKTQGADFLDKLRAQNPKLYVGAVPSTQAVASGEIIANTYTTPALINGLKKAGAPVDFTMPSPGLAASLGFAAFSWSRRPNAALVLVDYLMSPEGQAAWHGTGDSVSPRPGIPGSLSAASVNTWDESEYPPEVVAGYRLRWAALFK
jgi:iron(III) transport system substrate-binding protein